MLEGATCVEIWGGCFNQVGRDQINITQVFVSQPSLLPRSIPSTSCQERYQPPLHVGPVVENDPFLQAELLLRIIDQLLTSFPINLSGSLRQNLCELGTNLAQILRRMEQCAATLLRVHGRIAKLPYPSIPSWKDVGRLLLAWLLRNGQEPEDILSIRIEIIGEIEALGDFLGSLKSFAWATGLWSSVARHSQFTMQELTDFFASGSPSLRSLQVEEIIVIEPLGRALSDVHQFIQLGCYGTKGSTFIEKRQYQLDDPIINKTTSGIDSSEHLSHGRVLEVSILVQAVGLALTNCPRCGDPNNGGEVRNGWMQCCCVLFKETLSFSPSISSEILDLMHDPTYSSADRAESSNAAREMYHSEDRQNTFQSLLTASHQARYIFRRIKLEVKKMRQLSQGHSQGPHHHRAGTITTNGSDNPGASSRPSRFGSSDDVPMAEARRADTGENAVRSRQNMKRVASSVLEGDIHKVRKFKRGNIEDSTPKDTISASKYESSSTFGGNRTGSTRMRPRPPNIGLWARRPSLLERRSSSWLARQPQAVSSTELQ
ncbi:hypothetical protein BKA70DRAFT_1523195 [Coprinopsis sp. MPI-PUGE-AT-0042]|nr:hypothetical protein BKA70DRAFT_1523195 [Coprinopsis sp. MPI-PUGE-AT-0042]